jgi:hypothetical protein
MGFSLETEEGRKGGKREIPLCFWFFLFDISIRFRGFPFFSCFEDDFWGLIGIGAFLSWFVRVLMLMLMLLLLLLVLVSKKRDFLCMIWFLEVLQLFSSLVSVIVIRGRSRRMTCVLLDNR